jgi:hypothetical protein
MRLGALENAETSYREIGVDHEELAVFHGNPAALLIGGLRGHGHKIRSFAEPEGEVLRVRPERTKGTEILAIGKKKVQGGEIRNGPEKLPKAILQALGRPRLPPLRKPKEKALGIRSVAKSQALDISHGSVVAKENAVIKERVGVKAAPKARKLRRGFSGMGQKHRGLAVHRARDPRFEKGFRAEPEKVPSSFRIAEGVAEAIAVGCVLSPKAQP